jgi:OOP family OmpA-OmpF porin
MAIKKITLVCLAMMGAAAMSCAHATGAGTYLGFVAGVSNMNNKTQDVQLGTTPETAVPVAPSNTGVAGGFILGYQINPYAAFEFGYTHYPTSTYSQPDGSLLEHDSTINTNAIDIAMKGSFPFKSVNVFGKLGMIEVSASGSGSLAPLGEGRQPNNNALRPLYGVGVGYDISQNWGVSLAYTVYTGGGGVEGADLLGLEVAYHFVDLMCGQFLC